jgi:uncharacterized membrane protein YqaE (UPF0057 family)
MAKADVEAAVAAVIGKKEPSNLIIIMCILFPVIGVVLYYETCNTEACIAFLLSCLGWIPGIIYALVKVGIIKC